MQATKAKPGTKKETAKPSAKKPSATAKKSTTGKATREKSTADERVTAPPADTAPVTTSTATAASPPVTTSTVCPQGGDHEWSEENGERFCAKCKEPAPKTDGAKDATNGKGKTKRAPKSAAAGASTKPPQAKPEKPKRVTALDAAAQVLAASKTPLSAKELITAMADQKLWTSPAGQTPAATLYSAILREIGGKGKESRFKKVDAGKFAART